MDRTIAQPNAMPAPGAAPAAVSGAPASAPVNPAPQPTMPQQAAPIPAVPQGAPVAGGAPPPTGMPFAAPQGQPQPGMPPQAQPPAAAPQPPAVDWEARAQASERQLQSFVAELRQTAQTIQQERAEQQMRSEAQQRIDQAYETAKTMDLEEGLKYVRRVEDAERAQLAGLIQQTRQQAEHQKMQAIHQLAAPMYADKLIRENNLPADLGAQLKALPPQMMDQVLPSLVQAARYREQAQQTFAQQQLSYQAQQMQQSGAYSLGGVAAAGTGAPQPQPTTRSKRQADLIAYRQATGRG